MPMFAVEYVYSDSATGLRDEHRPTHRAYLDTLNGPVELLMSGPWIDGSGALLVFAGPDRSAVEQALDADPFHLVGAVVSRTVREWTPARGPFVGHT